MIMYDIVGTSHILTENIPEYVIETLFTQIGTLISNYKHEHKNKY